MSEAEVSTVQTDETKTRLDLIRAMELAEVAAWSQFFEAATPETVETSGIKLFRAGSAVAVFATEFDVLAFNRILGLGLNKVSVQEELEHLLPAAMSSGVSRFFVQINPLADTPELCAWLESQGLEYYNNWVRLHRDTSPVEGVKTDLRIEQIGEYHAEAFGRIITDSFEWPEGITNMGADLIGLPGWYHYLAFDGMKPVATAGMYVNGKTVWIDFAATLADYRGCGAQGALLQRRAADAAAQGGKYLVVETAQQKPDKPAPSYRNMIRYGFREDYLRPNFIWRAS